MLLLTSAWEGPASDFSRFVGQCSRVGLALGELSHRYESSTLFSLYPQLQPPSMFSASKFGWSGQCIHVYPDSLKFVHQWTSGSKKLVDVSHNLTDLFAEVEFLQEAQHMPPMKVGHGGALTWWMRQVICAGLPLGPRWWCCATQMVREHVQQQRGAGEESVASVWLGEGS